MVVVKKYREEGRKGERVAFEQQRKYNSPRRTNLPTILVLVTTISHATTSSLVFSSTQPVLLSLPLSHSLSLYLHTLRGRGTRTPIFLQAFIIHSSLNVLPPFLFLLPSPLFFVLFCLAFFPLHSYPLIHPTPVSAFVRPPSRAHFLRYVIHVLLTASLVSCPLSVLPYATVSSIILPPSHFSRQRSGVTLSRIDGNLYRWLLTEYHGFPRCWTIFTTDFRSLEGKLDGEDRMKRKKDVRNGEEREEII